jgi:hypothetical protein
MPGDDSLMSRFDRQGLRRFRAREAIVAVALASLLLVLCAGASVRRQGEDMSPGIGRDVVLAVGRPAGWLADRLPLERWVHRATAWLSPDEPLDRGATFAATSGATARGGVPPVTADAFDHPQPRRPLRTLLVTGDSMSTPLDDDIARALASTGVRVIRDPHLGSGISKSFLVDWGQLSTTQVRRDHPDATVVFIGANEGFPLPASGGRKLDCCGSGWAAAYASRVRRMAYTYRQGGRARVYWITLPTPRAADRQVVERVVNQAIGVAVEPWRAQVRVIDTVPIFTPHGWRPAMAVNGAQTIVRAADGIHLNDAGASLLAGVVLNRIRRDFTY